MLTGLSNWILLTMNLAGSGETRDADWENTRMPIRIARTIELDPQNHKAYTSRGYARIKVKDYEAALADFDMAILLEPKWVQPYAGRGDARMYLGEARKKIDHCQTAFVDYAREIALNPSLAGAYNGRCWANNVLGTTEEHRPTLTGPSRRTQARAFITTTEASRITS